MVLGGNHPNMVWWSWGMIPIPTINQWGCHTQLGYLKLAGTPCRLIYSVFSVLMNRIKSATKMCPKNNDLGRKTKDNLGWKRT